MWFEWGNLMVDLRLPVVDPFHYSTMGLPCVYHDVWCEHGSHVALPRLCGLNVVI